MKHDSRAPPSGPPALMPPARYFVSVSALRVFLRVSRTLALFASCGAGTARTIARLTLSLPRCARNSLLPALFSVILNTLLVPDEIEYDAVPIVFSFARLSLWLRLTLSVSLPLHAPAPARSSLSATVR